jgi:hypothetical protein
MKDDLNQLIDGDLTDDETAELLHRLSVDPEKRSMFRQQLKLQNVLGRNDSFDPMTSSEQAEMLGRLSAAVGIQPEPAAGGLARFGRVGAMLACLLIGTGLGYAGGSAIGGSGDGRDTVVVHAPPIQAAAPISVAGTMNCDSMVATLRDSLAKMQEPATSKVSTTPKKGKTSPRVSASRGGSIDDPTGFYAAKKHKKKR